MRCFSSPGLPSIPYVFRNGYHPIKDGGFPHSEISGSKRTYSSPKHIGVRPVLLRLLVPRHPPCALSSLTFDLLGIAAITHQLLLSSCIKNNYWMSLFMLSSFQGTRLLLESTSMLPCTEEANIVSVTRRRRCTSVSSYKPHFERIQSFFQN